MSGRLSIVTPPPFDFLPLHHRQLLATDFISLYVGIRTFPSRPLPLGSPTTTSQHHPDIGVLAMSLRVYAQHFLGTSAPVYVSPVHRYGGSNAALCTVESMARDDHLYYQVPSARPTKR